MGSGVNGRYRIQLGRPQRVPAQRIDNVVLQRRVKLLKFVHSSMSSTEDAAVAARSAADISLSLSVRRSPTEALTTTTSTRCFLK